MRKGFKIGIAVLVITLFGMVVIPAVAGWFQMM